MSFKEAENNSQCYEEDTGLGSQRCSREREKKKNLSKATRKGLVENNKKCPLTLNIMVFLLHSATEIVIDVYGQEQGCSLEMARCSGTGSSKYSA